MQVHRDPAAPPPISAGTVVSIGAYDGVHRGHHALLRLVRELATARGLESAIVTFDRHPAEVVRPASAPPLLTTLAQKLELLAATGLVDHTVVLTFDEARSKETADDFVGEVLVGICAARVVVVGADFHFGHNRTGNVPMLEEVGAQVGFEVIGYGLVAEVPGGPAYSSTRARHLLAEGDVAGAAEVLGRLHAVRGAVEEGDHRGRELGFPTANMAVPARICVPADGVYAGTVRTGDGSEHVAAISLGRRPTFYDERGMRLLEPYLLDFDGDLYGQELEVRFVHHLRPQMKFDGVDALVEQMRADVARTRELMQ